MTLDEKRRKAIADWWERMAWRECVEAELARRRAERDAAGEPLGEG